MRWQHLIKSDQVQGRSSLGLAVHRVRQYAGREDRKECSRSGLMDPDSFGIHYGLLLWRGSWIGHEGDDEVSKLPEGRAVHHLEHRPQRGDVGALRLAR